MKTENQIAALVLERRLRANPIVMQGEMREVLGEDEFGIAIQRRWLVANEDNGYLQVSGDGTRLAEMEALAKEVPPPQQAESVARETGAVLEHAGRNVRQEWNLYEIAAPATGKPAPGFAPQSSPTAASPTAPTPPAGAQVRDNVGDDVAVVDQGQTYQGKIAAVQPNGEYKISFGGPQRPSGPGVYQQNQIQRLTTQRR